MISIVSQEQKDAIVNDLISFVQRVSSGENATPAEIAALPEVARVLFSEMSVFMPVQENQ